MIDKSHTAKRMCVLLEYSHVHFLLGKNDVIHVVYGEQSLEIRYTEVEKYIKNNLGYFIHLISFALFFASLKVGILTLLLLQRLQC